MTWQDVWRWEPRRTPTVRDGRGPERVAAEEPPAGWVPPRPVGFVVWSDRDTGEVLAVADAGEPVSTTEALAWPLLWEGDQA